MRQHAAGVAVITTSDYAKDSTSAPHDGTADGTRIQGRPVGFCATSLTTVSLEPPCVSFTVAIGSTSGQAWSHAEYGIVHLLRADQVAVARRFSRSGPEKFAGMVGWRWGPGGAPLLDSALAWMLVSPRERLVVGDHLLVICDVREASATPGVGPLVHHDGGFHALPA
jgi:flavin reductase (DIM6/NTAB) family NADH-FMN oxidoreductase RutF